MSSGEVTLFWNTIKESESYIAYIALKHTPIKIDYYTKISDIPFAGFMEKYLTLRMLCIDDIIEGVGSRKSHPKNNVIIYKVEV